jgi:class I fructose-bisphosphate aldolase
MMSGPTSHVISLSRIVRQVIEAGADAVLLSPGQAARLAEHFGSAEAPALIIRADWTNGPRLAILGEQRFQPTYDLKLEMACGASDALMLGASAVTAYYMAGYNDRFERDNIRSLASLASECRRVGLPCIIEPIAAGAAAVSGAAAEALTVAARVAAELGADALKIPYTGDIESFHALVRIASIPVLVLGGAKFEDEKDALSMAADAIGAGAAGVVFGRNVTLSDDPARMVRKLRAIVHSGDPQHASA